VGGPNTARARDADPVAAAVASATEDERRATDEELAALREARADRRPFATGAEVTVEIAERSRRDE
jgi:hypothetical protein